MPACCTTGRVERETSEERDRRRWEKDERNGGNGGKGSNGVLQRRPAARVRRETATHALLLLLEGVRAHSSPVRLHVVVPPPSPPPLSVVMADDDAAAALPLGAGAVDGGGGGGVGGGAAEGAAAAGGVQASSSSSRPAGGAGGGGGGGGMPLADQRAISAAAAAGAAGAITSSNNQLLHVLQMQFELQQKSMDESKRALEADKRERELAQAQQQADAALSQLSKPSNREMARYLTAVSDCKDGKERAMITKTFIEMIRLQELDEHEIDEPNTILRKSVAKLKSLNGEQQEELIERVKLKKRKPAQPTHATAGAARGGMMCTRCGRDNHTADRCYATTAVDEALGAAGGLPTQAAAKRPMYRQMGGYGNLPFGAYANLAMQQMHAPTGYAAHFGSSAPQPMQQPAAGAGPSGGGVGGQSMLLGPQMDMSYITCFNCMQKGHKVHQCPLPRRAPQGSAVGPINAAPGTGPVSACNAEQRVLVGTNSIAADNVVAACVASVSSKLPVLEDNTGSMADAYMEGAWSVEEEEDEEGAEEQASNAGSAHREQSLYSVTLEAVHTLAPQLAQRMSQLEVAPVLASRMETTESLSQLAAQAREFIPKGTHSLRRAMQAEFAGKKKFLSDDEVLKQTCVRCKKLGHTVESCPDQTQPAHADASEADAWVRRLMETPRVDIAIVNKGLSLAEGVAAWKQRGEEFNRGNPWANSTKMEDSLKKQLGYHKALGMGSVHLGWIGFGVPLNFIREKEPRPLAFRNHKSAMEEEEFVDKEHANNLKDGSYVKVPREHLKGICPLQVVKHPVSLKRRLVQDLRWINGHLPNVKFRMESLHKELGDVVEPDDLLFTTDIAKAYYCLAMHPDAQQYLGWEWKGEFYMPTCLVFGLASAPRIFTKIMRPMMAFFRSLGVRVLGMIDDYMWADKAGAITEVRSAVQTVFPLLGWSFNAKCEWEPSDEVLMLGMLVNAKLFQVRAPDKKIAATTAGIKAILRKQLGPVQRPITIKEVQRVTGRLMSMMLALPGVRVFTRSLYQILAMALEGNETRKRTGRPVLYTLQLSKESIEELQFWLERMVTHNGLEINCRENQVQVLLWSDASDVGWGGEAAGVTESIPVQQVQDRMQSADNPLPVSGMAYGALPRAEIARSSTRRELVALLQVASTPRILEQIQNRRIRVIMDSVPALRNLIKGGGPVPELCTAVKEWTNFCEAHGIRAVYEWVERASNWRADQASKLETQQHTLMHASYEDSLRKRMKEVPATQWRSRSNHFLFGKVPLFLPMFHQVDARVEMIRSQLEEAIIVVPRWPGGGTQDWWRRVGQHSIAHIALGAASRWYREKLQTGQDAQLDAFWLMGRRGEAKRKHAACL